MSSWNMGLDKSLGASAGLERVTWESWAQRWEWKLQQSLRRVKGVRRGPRTEPSWWKNRNPRIQRRNGQGLVVVVNQKESIRTQWKEGILRREVISPVRCITEVQKNVAWEVSMYLSCFHAPTNIGWLVDFTKSITPYFLWVAFFFFFNAVEPITFAHTFPTTSAWRCCWQCVVDICVLSDASFHWHLLC